MSSNIAQFVSPVLTARNFRARATLNTESMKQYLAWCARVILLPLLPTIIGGATRSVYSGEWVFRSIDSTELAFSIALMVVIVLGSVSRLSDIPLRDSLSPLFVILLALALCFFAGAILMNLVHLGDQAELVKMARASVPESATALQQLGNPDRCTQILDQIRTATMVLGVITILALAIARVRYPIED